MRLVPWALPDQPEPLEMLDHKGLPARLVRLEQPARLGLRARQAPRVAQAQRVPRVLPGLLELLAPEPPERMARQALPVLQDRLAPPEPKDRRACKVPLDLLVRLDQLVLPVLTGQLERPGLLALPVLPEWAPLGRQELPEHLDWMALPVLPVRREQRELLVRLELLVQRAALEPPVLLVPKAIQVLPDRLVLLVHQVPAAPHP